MPVSSNPSTMSPPATAASPVADPPSLNLSVACGVLSSDPVLRELPSGDVVADLSVRTRLDAGPKLSVPVSWHRPGALAQRLRAGSEVLVVGHVARRFFQSGGRLVSRTELVAATVIRTGQKVRCRKALLALQADLEALSLDAFH